MTQYRTRLCALLLALSMTFSLLGAPVQATELDAQFGAAGLLSGQSDDEQASVQVGSTYYQTLKEAIGAAKNDETVTLLKDVETAESIAVTGTVILDLNGNGIRYTGTSGASVITVGKGANLTLKDSDTTAQHSITMTDGRGTAVDSSSLKGAVKVSGGYITGGFGTQYGGGVFNEGMFTMTGGTILGNTALQKGGGVCNGRTGTFVMQGGSILSNAAPIGGGLVNRNLFQLSGSPVITGNHTDSAEGAPDSNVCLEKKGTENTVISITGTLLCPEPIGVTMQKQGVFTSGLLGKGNVGSFLSDDSSFTVTTAEDGLYAGEAQLMKTPAEIPVINYESGVSLNYGYTTGIISVGVTQPKGHTLSYQWYSCDDTDRSNPIAVNGDGDRYSIPAGKNAQTREYYYCVVTAVRDDNGEKETAASHVITVTVRKADIVPTLSMNGWVYDGTPNHPKLAGNPGNGDVTYTYYRQLKPAEGDSPAVYDNGTDQMPTTAGVYKVVARVAETGNYNGDTAATIFTIAKAEQKTPDAPVDPEQNLEAVTSNSIAVAARPGEEYSIDGGSTWLADEDGDGMVVFGNLAPGTAYQVLGRAAGDENHEPSATYEAASTATNRGTQTPPTAAAEQAVTDSSITIAARPGEEYSIDGGKTWKKPGSGKNTVTFNGLTPGTDYLVLARKYETDTLFASEPSETAKVSTAEPGQSKTSGGSTTGSGAANASYNDLSDVEKKQADTVAAAFGSEKTDPDTAAQVVKTAEALGVDPNTVQLSPDTLSKLPDDSDPKGSSFNKLLARATKRSSNTMVLQWRRIREADGYLIYGNQCGKKYKLKLIKTIKGSKTIKWTQKKLKKGKYYKYMVIAYKNVSGLRMPIAASVTVHAATKGTKYTIAKAVQINVTKISLAAGKTFQLKASEVKDEPAKKISAHRKIKYESINPKVAKVNKNGKITAKKKGKTTLYVYSQNGLYKKVKVTVS